MNILIAIPCYGGNISNLTFHSLFNCIKPLNDMGHNLRIETLPTESLINRARNKFVTKFLDNKEFNGTHLLFIDADIGFTLQNLLRVIEFNREVVTCTYPVKGFYWQQLLDRIKENNNIDEQTMRDYLLQFNVNLYPNTEFKNGFGRVKESATGFMMIKREVFEKLRDVHPEWKFYDPNTDKDMYSFFDFKSTPEGYVGEDYLFCDRAREQGFTVWVDPTIKLGHMGMHEFEGDFGNDFLYPLLKPVDANKEAA
jgi:hypothetical protein